MLKERKRERRRERKKGRFKFVKDYTNVGLSLIDRL